MEKFESLSTILKQHPDAWWIDSNGARWASLEVGNHLTDHQAMTLLEWQRLDIPNCGVFQVLRDREGKPWLARDDRKQDEDQCVKLIGQRLDNEQLGGKPQALGIRPGTPAYSMPDRGYGTPRLPSSNLR
jgi:hypothetical protein